jgi:hypothetical protein
MTTWRAEITETMAEHGETLVDVLHTTLSESDLDVEFDSGYGGTSGKPFTLWTKTRVYFPIQYYGSEWVGSAPRNPSDEALEHQGGG